VLEFSVAKSSEFQPSDGLSLFSSAEEVQLLYHAIQETHYDSVSYIHAYSNSVIPRPHGLGMRLGPIELTRD